MDEHIDPDFHPGEIEIEFQHDYQHWMELTEEHVQAAIAYGVPSHVRGVEGGESSYA